MRKKYHRMNQDSTFGGNFSIRDDVRAPIQFRKEQQPKHTKRWSDTSISTSMAPVLLHKSNKTSWAFPVLKSTSQ